MGWKSHITLFWLLAIFVNGVRVPAQESAPQQPDARERPSGPVDRRDCAGCHSEVKAHAVTHGPVQIDGCASCHRIQSTENHTYTVPDGICLTCHDAPPADGPITHEPVANGACSDCHDPHGGADRAMLGSLSINSLCLGCHTDVRSGASVVHASSTDCTSCHRAHSARYPALLRDQPPGLCLDCHKETRRALDSADVSHPPVSGDHACRNCHAAHNPRLPVREVNALCLGCHDGISGGAANAHAPTSSCTACHNAHAAQYVSLLRQKPPGLCFDCHEQIRRAVESSLVDHAPASDERACTNCHATHSSDHPSLLVDETNALCLSCHDRELEVVDDRVLPNIQAALDGAAHIHEPVASGTCTTCHDGHGSDVYRLLNAAYPKTYYAHFNEQSYALCFGCHDPELATAETTSTATGFRDVDRNLHYVHVRKRRTCLICHRSHAGSNEHLVRTEVAYGRRGYKLTIGYEQTDVGGTCEKNCHPAIGYNRGPQRKR